MLIHRPNINTAEIFQKHILKASIFIPFKRRIISNAFHSCNPYCGTGGANMAQTNIDDTNVISISKLSFIYFQTKVLFFMSVITAITKKTRNRLPSLLERTPAAIICSYILVCTFSITPSEYRASSWLENNLLKLPGAKKVTIYPKYNPVLSHMRFKFICF